MAEKFRWGVIGPGRIARKFAASLPHSKGGVLQAVASTDLSRAENFAAEFGAGLAFGSYEEMLENGHVDAVYVATPNVSHFEGATAALVRKIPVLCEKPLTNTLAETQELLALANRHDTFLMEGLWTVFLPHFGQAQEWIQNGEIGEVIHCQADFGFLAVQDLQNRQFNPALGGGVLKDIGVYPLALFRKILNEPAEMNAVVRRAMNGTDAHVVFQGQTGYGATFQSLVSFGVSTLTMVIIYGTKGRIEFDPQWLRPVGVTLIPNEGDEVYFEPPVPGFGFQFEADEVMNCVLRGETESRIWSHADSLSIAHSVDVLQQF